MKSDSHEPSATAFSETPFEANLDAYAGDAPARRDGWTPFARRLFLEVLAETGRVSRACEYAGLSVSSAYALRHRDPMFATGWDAACDLARAPLADALYEQAMEGVTDTITRGGEVVAERHRFDSRLSIAVLHRLDRRCDLARERGDKHVPLIEHWDEWLSLVGKGAEADAAALLESARSGSAPHLQLPQLPLQPNPIEEEGIDLSDRYWKDEIDEIWMTDFPPPAGFDGWQSGPYGEGDYQRACTAEEIAIIEADIAADKAAELAEDEELRDAWFKMLSQASVSEQEEEKEE